MKKILPFKVKYQQDGEGNCGPNAIKHILYNKYNLDVPQSRLINLSNCSQKNGAAVKGILKVANNFNLDYYSRHNCSIEDLVNSIENDNPAILLIQAWPDKKIYDWHNTWEFGHYIDAIGVDTFKEQVFLYDPWDGKKKWMNYKTLDERWHDIDIKTKTIYDHFGIFFKG